MLACIVTDSAPTFEGFDRKTIAFFEGLHADNSKAYFDANRDDYEQYVRQPMEALLTSFESLFGPHHIFRPNRDLRFTDDKRPYKESVAGTVGSGRGTDAIGSRYVHLTRNELFVGAGLYQMDRGTLARFREVVAEEKTGRELSRILDTLRDNGYDIGGKELKVGPRDYPKDHPRIELLKHKGVTMSQRFDIEPWLFTPEAHDRVARIFGDAEPLVAWLRRHLTGYADPRG